MRAIVNVLGVDCPGIIAKISTALYECNANILDISQTVMGEDMFVMTMLGDLQGINTSFGDLQKKLESVGQELGMQIRLQREEIFKSMHRI